MEPIKKDYTLNLDNVQKSQKKKQTSGKDDKVNLQGKKTFQSLDSEKIKNENLNKIYSPSIILEIEPEILEKSEGLYECIWRKKDPKSGGFFYYFELKKEFKNLNDKELDEAADRINDELYPAMHFINAYNESIYEIYTKLGYKFKYHDSFILPDETIVLNRYKKMQQKNPNLSNLEIIPTEGEVSDKLFINMAKKGKILLSTGSQFIHDHTAHVMSRIELLYFCDKHSYDLVMKQFEDTVDRIMYFIIVKTKKAKTNSILSELLWSSLGLIVDNATALPSLNLLKNFLDDYRNLKLLITNDNNYYFEKRYGSKYLENKAIFTKTWHNIIDKTFEEI